jgi:hypothetical protein
MIPVATRGSLLVVAVWGPTDFGSEEFGCYIMFQSIFCYSLEARCRVYAMSSSTESSYHKSVNTFFWISIVLISNVWLGFRYLFYGKQTKSKCEARQKLH